MADAIVAQFTEITGSTPEVAAQYLQLTDDNLETAMQLYFENGGNPIQAAEPVPQAAPRSYNRAGYEDEQGVVHIDSDDAETPDNTQRPGVSPSFTPTEHTRDVTFDDDLAMARRLQEQFYTGGEEDADPDGVRAPMQRRTETLVGPGADLDSHGPMDAQFMHEQLRARRQNRGTTPLLVQLYL